MNKQQLANKIWASANNLRGKIDANEYKDYILGLIFYKFLSDNEVNYMLRQGFQPSDLPKLVEDYQDPTSQSLIKFCKDNVGYFIPYDRLFSTWLLPETSFTVADLSEALNAFDRLVGENYREVYDGIFRTLQGNLTKLGDTPTAQTRVLKELIRLIKDIPTDGSQDYDVLGYVYEYLIGNFAANAGKKAGEFYTPHEVAILMSEIVAEHHRDKDEIEIYDPTSGSGSLLITIGKSVGRHIADKDAVKYYAQELKENTYNLTRMNLVMRGIQPANIHTRCNDSLADDWPLCDEGSDVGRPLYVDAVVSNPPYSQSWDPTDRQLDPRFKDYGIAPKSKADYAFLLHELHHLKPDGILTIVLPHGVLFRTGEEEQIRKHLIERNNVDAIIGLPANIFFGTGIPTLIMVLKQHRTADDVLFIDASQGFVKAGKQNRLRASDIKRISDCVRDRTTIKGFSRTVSRDEIRRYQYNLNIPRYVDSATPAEPYDIYATLFGGIPQAEIDALQSYWDAFPTLRDELFAPAADGTPYATLRTDDVRGVIEENADVKQFRDHFAHAFDGFGEAMHSALITEAKTVNELQAQDNIAAEVFHRLRGVSLIDRYMAYQALADQWQMISSDLETIQQEGLDAVRQTEMATKVVKKGAGEVEVPDGLRGRIIPFSLVQREKLQGELQAIDSLQQRQETLASELDELRESFSEDEAEQYLDAEKDGAYLKPAIKAAAKPKADTEPQTKEKLQRIVAAWDEQTALSKQLKAAAQALTDHTVDALHALTDEECAHFLHLKWITPVCDGISRTLSDELAAFEQSVKALADKYAVSYQQVDKDMAAAQCELSSLVAQLTGDAYALKGLKALTSPANG